ncbi:MAG: hypothetical protein PGN24_12690 [Microbacterium arborescens]
MQPRRAHPQRLRQADRDYYWLDEVYAPEAGAAHPRRRHPHPRSRRLRGLLCGLVPAHRLLEQGFNGVPGAIASTPAEALLERSRAGRELPRHAAERMGRRTRRSARSTRTSPRNVRLDGLDDAAVRQGIQELVFNLNVPSRRGTQTPFTNLTFD